MPEFRLQAPEPLPAPPPAPPISTLSYSSLGLYAACGYRFYVERALRIPPAEEAPGGRSGVGGRLSAAERGILVHALLEGMDLGRPEAPTAAMVREAGHLDLGTGEVEEIVALVAAFIYSELRERLASAASVRREERFAFLLEPSRVLVNGVFDVLAREPGGRLLVVDYKSDRLEGATPAEVVERFYGIQRLLYALAALRSGADAVEVVHVFLEDVARPVAGSYTSADASVLEGRLNVLADRVLRREFAVTDAPHRAVCRGCPAEGGLCSWPLEMTRRDAPDRLF